jgi:hypothetical protein
LARGRPMRISRSDMGLSCSGYHNYDANRGA